MANQRYRKFRADHLFAGDKWLSDNPVLITTQQGQVIDLVAPEAAGDDIEYFPGILSPGFVNCHCHLELSHMKGLIPEGTGMVDFLIRVIRGRSFAPEVIVEAIAAAEQQMLDNGIVAVGDICNTADTVAQKSLGRMQYHNFIEAIGFVEATAAQRFEVARAVYEQFASRKSIVPHAPYSVSSKLLELIAGFAQNNVVSIHYEESEAETEFMKTGGGEMLRLFEALGIAVKGVPGGALDFDGNLIKVHNAVTTAVGAVAENRFFCMCANANLYIGNPLPRFSLFPEEQVVIGTDSLASNHQLDVLAELRTIRRHFPKIGLDTLLRWGTYNGARALRIDDVFGSFEVGKTPGVLQIDPLLEKAVRVL